MEAPHAAPRASLALHVLFALCSLAIAAAGIAYAWLWMFSNFQLYDDEGYFLVLVRHLLEGHRIYDDVTTAYGPAWLGYRWIVNGLCGAPLTTDGARWQSLAAWILCAALVGLLVRRATIGQGCSRWCALGAAAFAVLQLEVFSNEPGHPQDLAQLVFLGGWLSFLYLRERRPLAAAALLGAAVALQGWTKVNLGVFFALPVLFLFLSNDVRTWLRACGGLVLAAALALPWLLMRTHLSEEWGPALACVVDGGLIAAAVFGSSLPRADRRAELVRVVTGIALGSVVCVGFAMARGSTLAGIWHALVVLPSRFTTELVIGIRVPIEASWMAGAALVVALLAHFGERRVPTWLLAAAELGFGVFTLLNVAPHREWLIPFVLPWAWIVLVPRETRAVRLPLVLCAPLQALQVFPVSGSQEALGTVLLVALAGMALSDACTALLREGVLVRTRRVLAIAIAALLVLDATWVLANHAGALSEYRQTRQERIALPGVVYTRFDEATGARARFLADTLRGSFDDFLSVRGDGSLYSWTGIAPATGVIISHSWKLFDDRQQAELAETYAKAPHALLLDNKGRIPAQLRASLPFFRMLERDYHPVARIGADDLCVRRGAPTPELRSCVVLPENLLQKPGAFLDVRWPAASIEDGEVVQLQVANLAQRALFADSTVPDVRFHPRLWDGAELLFDAQRKPSVSIARLAAARALRLELPQPIPVDQASFSKLRFLARDEKRLLSLPLVIAASAP
ncbi:MAG: hypothetical protein IPJ19_08690 [Planctomycetes bacterium]|nr:hypothetical protein [Planctomycetota bacterium]